MYYRICECLNNAKKLSGSGDLGADYLLCFDSSENRKILQTHTCSLSDKLPLYISVTNNVLEGGTDSSVFAEYEQARRVLASPIVIKTLSNEDVIGIIGDYASWMKCKVISK